MIDLHIHLEEGPYTNNFFNKTITSIDTVNNTTSDGTLKDIERKEYLFRKRLSEGDYSEWWLDLYLDRALQKGLKQVGIVDHLYRFVETEDYFLTHMDVSDTDLGNRQRQWLKQVMTHKMSDFVNFINNQKEKWANAGVELKLGIEADYFVGGEETLKSLLKPYEFDYIIGSVHFNQGWGFDNPELASKFEEYDLVELYEDHFNTVIKAAESGIFSFIAHLDNLKVFNFRPDEELLIPFYKKVAKALVENNVATEVNVGLKYRYPVKEQCPSEKFINVLSKHNVHFTTSSDSHFPHDIGIYNEEIRALLKRKDVNHIVSFNKMKREKMDI
ncbi:histidinol phosphate phosphatase domain-containing protein [Macrococcoides goetzii]|uniref:histidinol phosphate phosphatase domain-containing protein n=1 Tax=Macrococcus TaxID=69965 RepID=UPI001EF1AB34|nr:MULTISPECIES: histidinol phosphate phosphatase domain-containing protein [Macrococcus]MCG7419614.1 histidinol phosphate phosphatase domain-containing protein [Macrococcus epidermidis]MCH4984434.1 histidinol phosphate phosphatase domain-containing protein [Macrococcus sp. PK]MCH4985165.1 histidinol phosphate phosphatase domain-containing protein [Macrococcus sp. PK]